MLRVAGLSKRFDGHAALSGVDFTLAGGEVLAVLGPSGSGKTTLLRLLAGLETPDAGRIGWGERDLTAVPVHRRGVGMMFQDYALFPHLDVAGNVGFGLRQQGQGGAAVAREASRLLALVGLAGYARRSVTTLSGGEQQRVALARALAPAPRLLLLDEPLGALDRALRESLLGDLHRILRELQQTAVYVTHDRDEAFAIADRVLVLRAGEAVQLDTPDVLYQQPASAWVAGFLGLGTVVAATVIDGGLRLPWGELACRVNTPRGAAVMALIRPGAVVAGLDDSGAIRGTVQACTFRGERYRITLATATGERLGFDVAEALGVGENVALRPTRVDVLHNGGRDAD